MKPQRTVTHLAAIPATDSTTGAVFAQCDDGTTWWLLLKKGFYHWEQLPAVPGTQPEAAE